MPPSAPRPTIWERWSRFSSTRKVGAVLFIWFLLVNVATTIQAVQTYAGLDWSGFWAAVSPWLVTGWRLVTSPMVTWSMGAVGLFLLWRIPAPGNLPEPPSLPQRPEEGYAVLRQLAVRGATLATEYQDPYSPGRYALMRRIRAWASEIAQAAHRYMPPGQAQAHLDLRHMSPNNDNALEFIHLHVNRIGEMMDVLKREGLG